MDVVSAVMPVFVVIGIGMLIKAWGLVDENFANVASRVVYRVALPCFFISRIGLKVMDETIPLSLIVAGTAGTVVVVLLSILAARFLKIDAQRWGSFVQGSFRGNLAYVALPVCAALHGEKGLLYGGLLLAVTALVYVPLAVTAFSLSRRDRELSLAGSIGKALLRAVMNPLVISLAASLLISLLLTRQMRGVPESDRPGWILVMLGKSSMGAKGVVEHVLLVFRRSLDAVAQMTLPVALITVGASTKLGVIRAERTAVAAAAFIKLLVSPLVGGCVMWLAGGREVALDVVVIIFSAPTATVSVIFAAELGGDTKLSSAVVTATTIFAMITMTALLVVLRAV